MDFEDWKLTLKVISTKRISLEQEQIPRLQKHWKIYKLERLSFQGRSEGDQHTALYQFFEYFKGNYRILSIDFIVLLISGSSSIDLYFNDLILYPMLGKLYKNILFRSVRFSKRELKTYLIIFFVNFIIFQIVTETGVSHKIFSYFG